MKNKNHVWVWFYPKQPKMILGADIYNSNCWQSVLATVKIHVNSRVGVFYPFFSNNLSDTEIITSANKSQPMSENTWTKEKGWLFWKLTFYSDFIRNSANICAKKTSFAQKTPRQISDYFTCIDWPRTCSQFVPGTYLRYCTNAEINYGL